MESYVNNFQVILVLFNVFCVVQTSDWQDSKHLSEAVRLAEATVAEADKKTGEAKCIYYRTKITYLYDDQVCVQPQIVNFSCILRPTFDWYCLIRFWKELWFWQILIAEHIFIFINKTLKQIRWCKCIKNTPTKQHIT